MTKTKTEEPTNPDTRGANMICPIMSDRQHKVECEEELCSWWSIRYELCGELLKSIAAKTLADSMARATQIEELIITVRRGLANLKD